MLRFRTAPGFTVFTSSIIQGERSIGCHPVQLGSWYCRSSICVFFFTPGLHSGSSHGVASGVGTIVQRNDVFADYTVWTSLSGRRLLLAFAFNRLNSDKEWW